jgi:predicted transcriptional regulator
MRGVARTVVLTFAVGALVTGSASAVLGLDDPVQRVDSTQELTREEVRVLLPNVDVTSEATDSALDASLPASAEAEARLQLSATATQTVPEASGLPAPTDGAIDLSVDTDAGSVDDTVDAEATVDDTPELDTPQLSTSTGTLDDTLVDDGTDASGEDEASTQSASAKDAGIAADAKQAWNEMEPAEKAAVSVGLLSLLVGPLAMYSRIKRSEGLDNDTRRAIYEIIEDDPGVCIQEAADRAGVSYSTASYHLKRLVKMDYVERREDGNKVRYYKNGGGFTQAERELVPVLKNDEAMAVFQHIVENPWCYRAEVAEALDVSHTTVNWHLDQLQEVDLVEEHREGRNCHLHVDDEALDRVTATIDKLEQTSQQATAEPEPAAVPA